MKTEEWLETLEEPFRSQALENLWAHGKTMDRESDSLSDALTYAFIWSDTPQEADYWIDLHYLIMAAEERLQDKFQENLNFGQAIEALKEGKLVARNGWNGKSMFLFIRPADTLKTSFIPKVKSLPQAVKHWIDENIDDKVNLGEQGLQEVSFGAYICMKAADNSIVNGWLASQTDMLAEDWYILS